MRAVDEKLIINELGPKCNSDTTLISPISSQHAFDFSCKFPGMVFPWLFLRKYVFLLTPHQCSEASLASGSKQSPQGWHISDCSTIKVRSLVPRPRPAYARGEPGNDATKFIYLQLFSMGHTKDHDRQMITSSHTQTIRPYQINLCFTDCLGQKHDPVGKQKNKNKNDQTSHKFN